MKKTKKRKQTMPKRYILLDLDGGTFTVQGNLTHSEFQKNMYDVISRGAEQNGMMPPHEATSLALMAYLNADLGEFHTADQMVLHMNSGLKSMMEGEMKPEVKALIPRLMAEVASQFIGKSVTVVEPE